MHLVEQFVFGTLLPPSEHEFSVHNFIHHKRFTSVFFLGGGLISHANHLVVFRALPLSRFQLHVLGRFGACVFGAA